MKRILILLLTAVSISSFGQSGWIKPNNSVGTIVNGISADSAMYGPTGCGAPTLYSKGLKKSTQYYDSCNKRFYLYDPKLAVWDTIRIGASSGSGSTNTSLGSGYKIAVNGTNDIKSLGQGWGVILDSATSGQVGITSDTSKLAKAIVYDLPITKTVGVSGAKDTVYIPPADDVNDGYLVAADYTSFRKKWGHNGNLAASGDWLGTTNTEPMIIKTNNAEVARISGDGNYRYSLSPNTLGQTGTYNLVFGYQPTTSNNYTFTGGYQTNASGLASVALNRNTTASANYAFASGSGSIASGNYSFAANNAQMGTFGGAGFGQFNEIATDASSSNSIGSTNRIFVIGNGSGTGNRHNALTVLHGSDLTNGTDPLFGFNKLAPTKTIDVVGTGNFTGKLTLEDSLRMSNVNQKALDTTNYKLAVFDASGNVFKSYWQDIITSSSTTTFTNKRWTARIGSTTSSVTPTINTDNYDIYKLTAQAADITSFTTNLSGTPVDGDILEIQITGTAARAITWGASFVSSTVILPTTTSTTATLSVIFQYYTTSSYGNNKWVCVNYY